MSEEPKADTQKSQMDYCMQCIHLVNGYTHTFLHGMLQTCTKGEFSEVDDCTLASRIPFCTTPVKDFKFPYCKDCLDGNRKYYYRMTCLYCFEVTKTCATCQNFEGFKTKICLKHGQLDKSYNGWGLKEVATDCKEYAEKTKPFERPPECRHCTIDSCPHALQVKTCLEKTANED